MKTCNFEIAVSSICSSCFFFFCCYFFSSSLLSLILWIFFFFRYFINDDNIVSLHILSMCIYSIYATTSCRSFHKIQVYNWWYIIIIIINNSVVVIQFDSLFFVHQTCIYWCCYIYIYTYISSCSCCFVRTCTHSHILTNIDRQQQKKKTWHE